MRHGMLGVGIVLCSVALAGCGGDDEQSSAASETSASLDGTYEITVAEEDETASGGAEPGVWTLTINSGDATLTGPGGQTPPLAPTTLSETEMVVPPDPECPNNDGEPGEGVYKVELSDESLEFTKVSDTCGDRAFTLTTYTWERTTP